MFKKNIKLSYYDDYSTHFLLFKQTSILYLKVLPAEASVFFQACDWPEYAGCVLPTTTTESQTVTPELPTSTPGPHSRRRRHRYESVVEVVAGLGLQKHKKQ